MYNGQVSVTQNRLAPLVRAAEALHIRGLSTESDEKQSPSSHLGIRRNSLDQDESFDSAPPQPQKKVIRRTPLGVANKPEQKPTVGGATSSSAAAPITQSVKRPSMSSNGGGSSGSSSGPPKLLKMRRIETPEASTSSWSPSSNLALQNKSSSSKLGSRRNTTELEESQSHRLNGEYEKGDEDMSKVTEQSHNTTYFIVSSFISSLIIKLLILGRRRLQHGQVVRIRWMRWWPVGWRILRWSNNFFKTITY